MPEDDSELERLKKSLFKTEKALKKVTSIYDVHTEGERGVCPIEDEAREML